MPSFLTLFIILFHGVSEKFDENCRKRLIIGNFSTFCNFSCQFNGFFKIKTALIQKTTGRQQMLSFLNVSNIVIYEVYRKIHKNVKNQDILDFLPFWSNFGSFWGHFGHSQKRPKIYSNIYHRKQIFVI